MEAATIQTVDRFSGVNNVNDATRFIPTVIDRAYVYPLREANNVIIDNTFQLASRTGYTSVLSGADVHSLWSDNAICFFVDGSVLKQMDAIYGLKTIRIGLSEGARMSFTRFNSRYYFTNDYQIGYVEDNASYGVTDPVREFKLPLPAGKFIEYFMGCLYVAKDDAVYISDPLCDYYDVRVGYRRFAKEITMLRAVDGGLYISDDKVWFVKGLANEDFQREEAYPSPAIAYTDVSLNGKYVGDNMVGNVAMWTGQNGICLGDGNGTVLNLTDNRYTFTARGKGTGFIRDISNTRHYINSLY